MAKLDRAAEGIAWALSEQRAALLGLRATLRATRKRFAAADREFVRAVESLDWDPFDALAQEGWSARNGDKVIDLLEDGSRLPAPTVRQLVAFLTEDRAAAAETGALEDDVELEPYQLRKSRRR